MSNNRASGILARAVFQKDYNDLILDEYDMKLWYQLKETLPNAFQRKFIALNQPDDITMQWLLNAKHNSSNILLQLWHALARTFLKLVMTQTDVNGFLRRGSMFILSENQFKRVLNSAGFNKETQQIIDNETINILDVGAGDGEISIRLSKSVAQMGFNANVKMFATETSWSMRKRLKELNITVLDEIKSLSNVPLISCLNVLDRCNDPYDLLQSIYNALAPNGRLIVALVLPYMHYVEYNSTHVPVTPLMAHWPDKANQFSFEAEATMFFELLENFGFRVEAWTKAPYLCEGDLKQSFYWLTDLVVVLSKNK